MSMTDEQIRRAMAVATGWKIESTPDEEAFFVTDPSGKLIGERNDIGIARIVPDFLNDLNAMAEARRSLTPAEQRKFGEELCKIVQRRVVASFVLYAKYPWIGEQVFALADSTAAEQAEAFLRVKALWRD